MDKWEYQNKPCYLENSVLENSVSRGLPVVATVLRVGILIYVVHLSLKPFKCDQCDKSIEAVGNEHSFQYYENIKKIS